MNDDQLLRYSRHIMLPELDVAGQELLLSATVLLIGLGGLGSPIALYLAAAGIGHLVLVDHDTVDRTNLQRQDPDGMPASCIKEPPVQLSEALKPVKLTVVAQAPGSAFAARLVGQTIVGAMLSTIVATNVQLAELPAASVTTKVHVVAPNGNNVLVAKPAICVVVAPGQLSAPTGVG